MAAEARSQWPEVSLFDPPYHFVELAYCAFDTNDGYTGKLPMGQLLAIPNCDIK